MVEGNGIDIVEIAKLERAVNRWGDLFLKRIFTDGELIYSKSKRFPMQHLAARFAAKEAIFKAFGTDSKLNFRDIEISNDSFGRPFSIVKNKTEKILLSISHTENYAIASAIIQKGS